MIMMYDESEGKVFTPNDHDEADANICTSHSTHLLGYLCMKGRVCNEQKC